MPFDHQRADQAEQFFTLLKHWKGEHAGQVFNLEPWQRDIVREVWGRVDEYGHRVTRTVFIAVPRKNGKSTWAAGLGLLLLMADGEPGAEVYCCASDRDQAAIVFQCGREFIEDSVPLSSRCQTYRREIKVPHSSSTLKVLSAEAYSKHGLNASGIVFDELHAQPNRDLVDVMETSTASRRQPLTIYLTTAGVDRQSICFELWDYAVKVRDGVIDDPTFLPVIYAAEPEDDWTAPEVWAKANPNLGVSVRMEYLERKCRDAIELPSGESAFRRLHLNQWVDVAVTWLGTEDWNACSGTLPPDEQLAELPCYGGLDLSTTTDLAALSLVWVRPGGGYYTRAWFWVPEDSVRQRVKRDRVPYDVWVRQGLISTTSGNILDYDRIRDDVLEVAERFNVAELAIDRWNATQITTQLQNEGLTVVPFGQGYKSMNPPTKELEKIVIGEQLTHDGNPVLAWNVSNLVVESDAAGNLKPAKNRSTERIDGAVALIMALGRGMVVPTEMRVSDYGGEGIRRL
jgi:phage terminase large subunit-like protein